MRYDCVWFTTWHVHCMYETQFQWGESWGKTVTMCFASGIWGRSSFHVFTRGWNIQPNQHTQGFRGLSNTNSSAIKTTLWQSIYVALPEHRNNLLWPMMLVWFSRSPWCLKTNWNLAAWQTGFVKWISMLQGPDETLVETPFDISKSWEVDGPNWLAMNPTIRWCHNQWG